VQELSLQLMRSLLRTRTHKLGWLAASDLNPN
jgi:hypothetical protein